jgi:hypothetical protein
MRQINSSGELDDRQVRQPRICSATTAQLLKRSRSWSAQEQALGIR